MFAFRGRMSYASALELSRWVVMFSVYDPTKFKMSFFEYEFIIFKKIFIIDTVYKCMLSF